MDRATIKKRSKIETFIKVVNFKHLLPTRYKLPITKKWGVENIHPGILTAKDQRRKTLQTKIKWKWQRYYFRNASPTTRWFFKKLYI